MYAPERPKACERMKKGSYGSILIPIPSSKFSFNDGGGRKRRRADSGGAQKLATLAVIILALVIFSAVFESRSHSQQSAREKADNRVLEDASTSNGLKQLSGNLKYPHIIYILVDDLGFGDSGADSVDFKDLTPNLNSLAETGVSLSSYYTQFMCTPTRAALLTGKYPFKMGMQHDSISTNAPWGLGAEHALLPELLAQATGGAYHSHLVGKWHLGFARPSMLPAHRGFASFYGILTDQADYLTHETQMCLDMDGSCFLDFSKQDGAQGPLLPLVKETKDKVYAELAYAHRVEEIVARHAAGGEHHGAPLHLHLAHQLPHLPLQAPPADLLAASLTQTQQWTLARVRDPARQTYGWMVAYMDALIGRTVAALKEHGLYEDAVIVVASDNGGCPDAAASNGPLRGHKGTLYEGGVRVRALLSSPLLPEGRRGATYDGLFHVTDWVPTLVEGLLGQGPGFAYPGAIDGVDQWAHLVGEAGAGAGPARSELVVNLDSYDYVGFLGGLLGAQHPKAALVREDPATGRRLKLLLNESPSVGHQDPVREDGTTCKVLAATQPSLQLYDLGADPGEARDLAGEEPAAVVDLLARLQDHRAGEARPLYVGEEHFGLVTWLENDYFVRPWKDDEA